MSNSFGFYMIIAAAFVALFSTLSVAAPASELQKRDYTGKATWFYVGLGSCGETNVDTDYIVALNPTMYASGSHCGKQIQITDAASGVSATATVRDTCPGCGVDDLGQLIESLPLSWSDYWFCRHVPFALLSLRVVGQGYLPS
ncbi:hypothetical protein H0H93_006786 [Arthromyces matolae]|nr:hypothetical protein H0H93_006786 [Arthromyces matolae]